MRCGAWRRCGQPDGGVRTIADDHGAWPVYATRATALAVLKSIGVTGSALSVVSRFQFKSSVDIPRVEC